MAAESVAGQIDDPGGKNQQQQIEHLNKLRQEIDHVRNRVLDGLITNRITEQKANTAYRQAIVTYVMQLAPYLQSDEYGSEEDSELWDSQVVGTFTATAPDIDTGPNTRYESIEPEVFEGDIEGVKSLIEMPSPIPVKFTVRLNDEVRGEQTETYLKHAEIDRATLDMIVIKLEKFRVDIGLGMNSPDEVAHGSEDAF